MKKKLSIKSSILWNSIGSTFYLICQWLMTVLVVRLTGIDTAGLFSLAMSVCNIWFCIALYGMKNFQISDTTEKYSNGTYIFSRLITILVALIGCLIFVFLIPYNAKQRICILFYYIFKSSEAFHDVYSGIFQKKWRLDYAGKSMILRGILSLSSFIIILKMTQNLILAICFMSILCFIVILLYDMPIANKISNNKWNKDRLALKNLLKECFPLVIYTLLSNAIVIIPRLVMERILGEHDLGIYNSVAMPTLIIQMAVTYIFLPFATLFAEWYNQKEKQKFISTFRKCNLFILFLAMIGIFGGKLFGKWGLLLLYGEEISVHNELLIPLIICTILTAFSWLFSGILTAIREINGLIYANAIGVILSILLSILFEKKYGMQGASIALALANVVTVFFLYQSIQKAIKKQL